MIASFFAPFFASTTAMILLTGILVGGATALLGCFLVLRGNALLSDAISHSIVFGIIVVWLLTGESSGPFQVLGAALTGVVTVVLVEMVTRSGLVKMDAAIGLVFPAMFAAGVLLISLFARDVHIDIDMVLLGEIGFVWLNTVVVAGVDVPVAVVTMSLVLLINLAFVLLLWKELKISTFDPALAATLGFLPAVLHYGVMTLTSITAVAAFDAVGAILFVAFMIVPAATAYLLTRQLWLMVVLAVALSVAACVSGYWLAVYWNVSIAGMMAAMTGVWFTLALLFAPRQGLIAQVQTNSSEKLDHDCRKLVVFLYTHKGKDARHDTAAIAEENAPKALMDHLSWTEKRAQTIISRARAQSLIERRDGFLWLCDKGRAEAKHIFGG